MTKVEAFVKSFGKSIDPDDVVLAILSNLQANEIAKDPSIIHSKFFRLKAQNEYKGLLDYFQFNTNGLSPFSEELDRVLFRLEAACILGTLNPKYDLYHFASEKKETIKRTMNKKLGSKAKVVEKMSRSFEGMA